MDGKVERREKGGKSKLLGPFGIDVIGRGNLTIQVSALNLMEDIQKRKQMGAILE